MKKYLFLPLIVLCLSVSFFAQSKSNEAIEKQIRELKASNIVLSYDAASNMSKIMVTGSNFGEQDAKRAGVEAINFGMAHFYQGKSLTNAPDELNFTFWVLTKKPRFTDSHKWAATLGTETLDLGDARYVSKPKENMEYLNFKISRANLEKIAKSKGAKIKLGDFDMQFTPEQLKTFNNLLELLVSE